MDAAAPPYSLLYVRRSLFVLRAKAAAEALEERVDVGAVQAAVPSHVPEQQITVREPRGVRGRVAQGQEKRVDIRRALLVRGLNQSAGEFCPCWLPAKEKDVFGADSLQTEGGPVTRPALHHDDQVALVYPPWILMFPPPISWSKPLS